MGNFNTNKAAGTHQDMPVNLSPSVGTIGAHLIAFDQFPNRNK
jgi:hypothetical protein